MKHVLKLTGVLLLDQFIGIISGCMLVLCVSALFNNSLTGYILAFCICFSFYAYVTYNSAYKSGFHDNHRVIKDTLYKGYLYKGAISGGVAAIPVMFVYIFYRLTGAGILEIYHMICSMYWSWPMRNIFPNHKQLVLLLGFVPMIIIPWLGYIAGYKNFWFTDFFLNILNKFNKEK